MSEAEIHPVEKVTRNSPSQTAEVERALSYEMDTMAAAVNYRRWLHRLISPYLGESILEVGAGTGEFAEHYTARRVLVTDVHPEFVATLADRFADRSGFEVGEVSIEEPITAGEFDSVVAINLLEHIPDDVAAMKNMAGALAPGGRVIIFVPAFPALYGPLDEMVGHHRRYTRRALKKVVASAGLEIEEMRFVNSAGMVGWWTFVRLLRGSKTSERAVRLYDRVAVPVVSRIEGLFKPPFGQSLLCVARAPLGTGEAVERASPPRRGFRKLSVIMPVYNEEAAVVDTLERVLAVELPSGIEMEVIVVDDGSTDRTSELLATYSDHPLVFVHTSLLNLGKGTAVRTGLAYATGDIVLIQDGDREYSPADYPKLIRPIIEGEAAVVYGTRFREEVDTVGGQKIRAVKRPTNMPLLNLAANRILAWTTNMIFASSITDEASAYKVFRSDVLDSFSLESRRFEICPELTAKVLRSGYRIREVPISYNARRMEQGRKIRWYDLFAAIWALVKYRFAPLGEGMHRRHAVLRRPSDLSKRVAAAG